MKVFAMRALPFGASRSVYGFLRVSHSPWWLGCKALSVAWSKLFDDPITFARKQETELVSVAALQFFKLSVGVFRLEKKTCHLPRSSKPSKFKSTALGGKMVLSLLPTLKNGHRSWWQPLTTLSPLPSLLNKQHWFSMEGCNLPKLCCGEGQPSSSSPRPQHMPLVLMAAFRATAPLPS